MKINELFLNKKVVFSMEVFPPNKRTSQEAVREATKEICKLKPDYVSVTYGAGGINSEKSPTIEIAQFIKNECNVEPLAHLTCVNSKKDEVLEVITGLKDSGIQNVLALRGDKNPELSNASEFTYASELVKLIKENADFNISGACYPEGHTECESIEKDIDNLKFKIDAGVNHLITQLFFDNNCFYDYMDKLAKRGISAPVSAGIMPVVSANQIKRIVTLSGASLPSRFSKMIAKYEGDPEALRDAGIAYATNQIIELLTEGVRGIHLYTMNNPYVAQKISESVKSMINSENCVTIGK